MHVAVVAVIVVGVSVIISLCVLVVGLIVIRRYLRWSTFAHAHTQCKWMYSVQTLSLLSVTAVASGQEAVVHRGVGVSFREAMKLAMRAKYVTKSLNNAQHFSLSFVWSE